MCAWFYYSTIFYTLGAIRTPSFFFMKFSVGRQVGNDDTEETAIEFSLLQQNYDQFKAKNPDETTW